MSRDGFVSERHAAGRFAKVEDPHPCPRCGAQVEIVLTRETPIRQWIVFDAGPEGEMHYCRGGADAA